MKKRRHCGTTSDFEITNGKRNEWLSGNHDLLWISYYASHEGKTNVYLAKVKLQNQ